MDDEMDRKMMAAMALSGLMANPQAPNDMSVIAKAAVAAADAVLKELAKGVSQEPEAED